MTELGPSAFTPGAGEVTPNPLSARPAGGWARAPVAASTGGGVRLA